MLPSLVAWVVLVVALIFRVALPALVGVAIYPFALKAPTTWLLMAVRRFELAVRLLCPVATATPCQYKVPAQAEASHCKLQTARQAVRLQLLLALRRRDPAVRSP